MSSEFSQQIFQNVSTVTNLNIPNPKRIAYERKLQAENNRYNPTITGYLGPYILPIGLISAAYLLGCYLYHQFIPVSDLITRSQCLLILGQMRKAWSIAITESSRQETKLLDDYSHLSIEQQAHLIDILRQTLISDLDQTEKQICLIHKTTQNQVKQSVDYYTNLNNDNHLYRQFWDEEEQSAQINGDDDDDDLIQLRIKNNQKISNLTTELKKFVQLVLPQPELPLGWSLSSAIELLSQWFELRLIVMEKTFFHLVFNDPVFEKIKPQISTKTIIAPQDGYNAPIETIKLFPNSRLKLNQEQMNILNVRYAENIATQMETFCSEKGVQYSFLLRLNRCVMNTDEFLELTTLYKEQQLKRLSILGISVQTSGKPSDNE
jgi:hypothetical protein